MTVKETIYYFGRIYGMSDDKIREKYKLLRDLLQLPPAQQLVKKCSGGQQRRVSFASAMIHDPELLILDEPTVGLDPILREKIWDFLVESTRNSKMAVIITTHYIEEAKKANIIGLMRNGILLAEDTPERIMNKFESNSIEEAFLILSQKQGDDIITSNPADFKKHPIIPALPGDVIPSIEFENRNTNIEKNPINYNCNDDDFDNRKRVFFTTRGRIKALMTKNFVQLFRQPSGIIFMLMFPLIQLSCFYLAIGKTPTNLRIGIVNEEVDDIHNCFNSSMKTVTAYNETCEFNKVSCRYIKELGDGTAHRIYFKTKEDAFDAARRTDVIGFLHFSHNFSESLQERLNDGRFASNAAFEYGQLNVRLDQTDQQISYFLERRLREAFENFLANLLEDCGIPRGIAGSPVHIMKPIFGTLDSQFQQYVAPGVVMTMVFFLATLMTAAVFISERTDGVWDRTLVAGVSANEMLWAHLLSQFIIMAFQSFEVIMYIGLVFNVTNHGNPATLIGLLTMTAFCGMLFGLLISVYCSSHTMANFVATGAFYPMIILCGLLWPLEGMPKLLQHIVMFFPFTIPTISARNILEKGWSIMDFQVYNGFIVMAMWIVIFFTACVIGLKRGS
ncbi:hypothetical protein ACFFRR_005643 [Megaselia abdita]